MTSELRKTTRFSVLRHDGPDGLHWDFFLEMGPVLKTWALPRPPESGVEMPCTALPDHRLLYLDYEGPVSGDRGTVSLWDRGTYCLCRLEETELVVELTGEKLIGRAVLKQQSHDRSAWCFSFVQVPATKDLP
ncbi:MAG TPA: DNA polymerase ligase N-terminal domain-containing protein [Thermoguttaceae bacterium]|nr:DNA polymerase ligase N-terminal domain-containing protein [Thermoguttaceae bacterium]